MPVEAATTIESLDESWPLSGDVTSRGDDHLRLVKFVLKNQFPGVSGNGFGIPITAKETELNFLAGLSSNAQDQLNALAVRATALEGKLNAASGEKLIFPQASAPTGWTIDATHNDAMLRIVDTTGGGSGGADSPISFDTSHMHTTGDHALIVSEMPAHGHNEKYWQGGGGGGSQPMSSNGAFNASLNATSDSVGGGGVHNHGNTGSEGALIEFKYVDSVIGIKD